jgi:hypothetical protein
VTAGGHDSRDQRVSRILSPTTQIEECSGFNAGTLRYCRLGTSCRFYWRLKQGPVQKARRPNWPRMTVSSSVIRKVPSPDQIWQPLVGSLTLVSTGNCLIRKTGAERFLQQAAAVFCITGADERYPVLIHRTAEGNIGAPSVRSGRRFPFICVPQRQVHVV